MTSFVDVIRPVNKSRGIAYDLLCLLGGSLFLALMAHFSIPLWFTPVPITLQTLGVLLIGALLGSKKGALSVLVYLAEGTLGLPVFAGGAAGIGVLMGPTGGYLFGFVITAFVVGALLEKGWRTRYAVTLVALAIGSALTLGLGAIWLAFFVGAQNALLMGVYPFLVDCVLKILAATAMIPSGWKALDLMK